MRHLTGVLAVAPVVLLAADLAFGQARSTMKVASRGAQKAATNESATDERTKTGQPGLLDEPRLLGDCSRCFVEFWRKDNLFVRTRICGQLPTNPRGITKMPPMVCIWIVLETGETQCVHGDRFQFQAMPLNQRSWKDYAFYVGPDAIVEFNAGANPKERASRGPQELALGEEFNQPWPLRVTCK